MAAFALPAVLSVVLGRNAPTVVPGVVGGTLAGVAVGLLLGWPAVEGTLRDAYD